MKRKIGALAALALVSAQAGLPTTALAQEASDFDAQCAAYSALDDRSALQEELATLIETDPNNRCIDFIVELLGGSPIADVTPQVEPY